MKHLAARLVGYIPDLPTPFDENDGIDFLSLTKLCERQINAGANALVIGETTGEAPTLTPEEHGSLVRAAVRTAQGRVPVIAGIASNATSQAVELAKQARADGADAVLAVVPYYNKPMQAGIHAHFQAIAEATTLPVILHDVPARTVCQLTDDTIARVAESKHFVGLKDSTGDVTRPYRLKAMVRPDFRLLSGNDPTAMAFLIQGGDGCISVTSNVAPHLCRNMFLACRKGDLPAARALADRLAQLTAALYQDPTSAPVKYAMSLLGLMMPGVRLPIVELADSSKCKVATAIASVWEADEDCLRENWHGGLRPVPAS